MEIESLFRSALEYQAQNRSEEAEAGFLNLLIKEPSHAGSWQMLSLICLRTGRQERALELGSRLCTINPGVPRFHNNHGIFLQGIGREVAASEAFRRAVTLDPAYAFAQNNLGNSLERQGDFQGAENWFRRSCHSVPDDAAPHINLGNLLKEGGQVGAAVAEYRTAVRLAPESAPFHSCLLLALLYTDNVQAEDIRSEHEAWSRRHALSYRTTWTQHPNTRLADRRLRVGFVSSDLRDHAVARFILPVLESGNRHDCEIVCYSDSAIFDSVSAQIRSGADIWRSVAGMTDDHLNRQIRADRIDVLVDLNGHSGSNRLLTFARRPAPVQVSYLGYAATTGLFAMDYRLVDRWSDPPTGSDTYCCEKLWRLPTTAWCYRPPFELPVSDPKPSTPERRFVFGSFNTLAKVTDTTVALWSQILHESDRAILMLKARALADRGVRDKLLTRFEKYGVRKEQLELIPWTDSAREHLDLYRSVDLGLDTFPYHGTTTTCEAVWMGVPVITLQGNLHHSRVGVSLMHSLGLERCVAATSTDYVRNAVDFAKNPGELQQLKAGLRTRMEKSPLRDEAGFARDFFSALREMWALYCRNEG